MGYISNIDIVYYTKKIYYIFYYFFAMIILLGTLTRDNCETILEDELYCS